MNKNLNGKVVVITGAGSGIGRETALLCARRGAALAICDVNEPGLEQTAEDARAPERRLAADMSTSPTPSRWTRSRPPCTSASAASTCSSTTPASGSEPPSPRPSSRTGSASSRST